MLWALVALAAWRLKDERGEALRDLLMHPRARAFFRAEFDVLLAMPRLLLHILARSSTPGLTYNQGGHGAALALAFTPALLAEALALYLLLPDTWVAVHAISALLHVYFLLWLWGWALGPHAYPHRVGAGALIVRNGPLYRARVPLEDIVSAEPCRDRVTAERQVVLRDGAALLPARGRVDLWLTLDREARIHRPLGEPLCVRRLAVASDEPQALAELLRTETATESATGSGLLASYDLFDLAGLTRDVAQAA